MKNPGQNTWKSALPGFTRDPIERAISGLEQVPDPKQKERDVLDAIDRARNFAACEDLNTELSKEARAHFALMADYLAYYQILLMKASRTLFKGMLLLLLLAVLVGVMLFSGKGGG